MTGATALIVFGAVRSGTTMFRLMLNAHPALVEIGENRYLVDSLIDKHDLTAGYDPDRLMSDRVFRMRDLARPDRYETRAVIDHVTAALAEGRDGPLVLTFHADAEVVDRLFPGCRFLHIVRDPRDVAASAVRFGWAGNHYHGAEFWLEAEESWARFAPSLPPDRRFEIRFEDLVGDPEGSLTQVCSFIGVPFDSTMLRYAAKSTYAAPDSGQREKWRRTLGDAEVRQVEERCGALMAAQGYDLFCSAIPARSKASLAWLKVDNKLRKTAARIAFFGPADYFSEKIARLPFLRGWHMRVERRMQERVNRSLK